MIRTDEVAIQGSIVEWLRTVAPDVVTIHVPNGELRDKRTAAKLKYLGVHPGVPDLLLIPPSGKMRWMEVKTATGRLSEAQDDFRHMCILRCIPWALVRSIEDARTALEGWGVVTREARAA